MQRLLFMSFLILTFRLAGQSRVSEAVRLNQIGFYPDQKKIAVIVEADAKSFQLMSPDLKQVFFKGETKGPFQIDYSPKKTRLADFSAFTREGTYVVVVDGLGHSSPFEIRKDILNDVSKASLKFFYFQRFSIPLLPEYAGKWARKSSGNHRNIVVHGSAAAGKRTEGSFIASPRGWIDAGDYNKYVVNSGITTATLLLAYEDFSNYYDTLHLNIPESRNKVPDIIDEVLWNLRWMLTMQDPFDGGVYHKCTNAKFSGMIQPDQDGSPRYVVQKSTAAALDFTAVAAQASVILRKFEKQFPGLADSCLKASQHAWAWAQANPAVIYDQRKMNEQFDPDVSTGEYGDRRFEDEKFWAATELFSATRDSSYLRGLTFIPGEQPGIPSWNQVFMLGYYRLLRMDPEMLGDYRGVVEKIKSQIIQKADEFVLALEAHPYHTVMGNVRKDFVWGSNSVAANQSIFLINAYRLKGDPNYLEAAASNMDYVLGRNATGYSYVTGFGNRTPRHPHHRPSESDGVVDPIPGMLVGGPNPGMQDKCQYHSNVPDEAYVDDVCSYASNEVAINWNAPLVYALAAMECSYGKK